MIPDGNLDEHKEMECWTRIWHLTELTEYPGKDGQLWKAQDSHCAREQQSGPPAASGTRCRHGPSPRGKECEHRLQHGLATTACEPATS